MSLKLMGPVMERRVQEKGFKDLDEFNDMVAEIALKDLTTASLFHYWKHNDQTKDGLLSILNRGVNHD